MRKGHRRLLVRTLKTVTALEIGTGNDSSLRNRSLILQTVGAYMTNVVNIRHTKVICYSANELKTYHLFPSGFTHWY